MRERVWRAGRRLVTCTAPWCLVRGFDRASDPPKLSIAFGVLRAWRLTPCIAGATRGQKPHSKGRVGVRDFTR